MPVEGGWQEDEEEDHFLRKRHSLDPLRWAQLPILTAATRSADPTRLSRPRPSLLNPLTRPPHLEAGVCLVGAMEDVQGESETCWIANLPPELLYRVFELAVDGLPPTIRLRSSTLRHLALVASSWREPAQSLLESKVHIDSYHRARGFLDRPRRLHRPLVLDELVLFFDFSPHDDDFFPLTEFMTRSICEMDCQIRALHLRSALFVNSFDAKLLLLPSFRGEFLEVLSEICNS